MSRAKNKFTQSDLLKHGTAPSKSSYISSLLLLVLLMTGCAQQTGAPTNVFTDITAEETFNLIKANEGEPNFIIVDVRTPEEFAGGHIANAIMVDFRSENFREEIDKLDKDKTYLIYCRTGNRSRGALDIMAELGFQKVYHLTSGIVGWLEEGLPVTK
ncbi:MAG: rhodanese-like domain-containing protein [Dehalococcoidales bacterium]|nr:rhodanese-like domain-containing protein [Dehalococcoidales bacterium]